MKGVIVDAHTHAFPPSLIQRRDELIRTERLFGELYANPRARMATAADVLSVMALGQVDAAVIAGFAWDDPALCREHNEYLLRAAEASRGALLPFCTLPLGKPDQARLEVLRCVRGGARGFGELRPESQRASLDDPTLSAMLSWAAVAYNLPLLFHASEPVGHRYAGKQGQSLGPLYDFIHDHDDVHVIAAHWGGGLPFYALMPEVKLAMANVWVDTAATTLLYNSAIFRVTADVLGADRILFGSDYPLLSPQGQITAIQHAPLTDSERSLVLGENAAAMLGLGA